jgi:hypothetical protein
MEKEKALDHTPLPVPSSGVALLRGYSEELMLYRAQQRRAFVHAVAMTPYVLSELPDDVGRQIAAAMDEVLISPLRDWAEVWNLSMSGDRIYKVPGQKLLPRPPEGSGHFINLWDTVQRGLGAKKRALTQLKKYEIAKAKAAKGLSAAADDVELPPGNQALFEATNAHLDLILPKYHLCPPDVPDDRIIDVEIPGGPDNGRVTETIKVKVPEGVSSGKGFTASDFETPEILANAQKAAEEEATDWLRYMLIPDNIIMTLKERFKEVAMGEDFSITNITYLMGQHAFLLAHSDAIGRWNDNFNQNKDIIIHFLNFYKSAYEEGGEDAF